jgi:hypothetical protein
MNKEIYSYRIYRYNQIKHHVKFVQDNLMYILLKYEDKLQEWKKIKEDLSKTHDLISIYKNFGKNYRKLVNIHNSVFGIPVDFILSIWYAFELDIGDPVRNKLKNISDKYRESIWTHPVRVKVFKNFENIHKNLALSLDETLLKYFLEYE